MRDASPILETHRLHLREFRADDRNALGKILSDAETMRFYPGPFDDAGVADWIERNRRRYEKDGFGLWAMISNCSGELIGDCGLIRQLVDGSERVEIGYHVRRDLWGDGLATEAARACRDHGFGQLQLEELISLIRPGNLSSRRVAEKNGLTTREEILWREFPHSLYTISWREWAALNPPK